MQCPVCRAGNNEGTECRRCRADLRLLVELEQQRNRLLRQAAGCAVEENWSEVTRLSELANSLRKDADSQKWLATGFVMQHDFDKAWRCYRQCTVG